MAIKKSDKTQDISITPKRRSVEIQVKSLVEYDSKIYRISQILDFNSVIGIDVETGRSHPLLIGNIRRIEDQTLSLKHEKTDILEIGDSDWQQAEQRFAAIKPLLNENRVGRNAVEKRAKELKTSSATLYRWIDTYKKYGEITALVSQKRGWKEGNSRINSDADAIINKVIKEYYLTVQRPTIQKSIIEVLRLLNEQGIKAPSPSAIRARFAAIPDKVRLRGRGFKEQAINKYMPAAGKFPNQDFPLSVVQIDHTPFDIIVVDDVNRKPIGRPYLTVALDVYSRMIVGYYLSFDPPSVTSLAMCVSHMMIPKEEWLLLHKVDAQWPVWGKPKTIHVDNGAEFRSADFRKSCTTYGINLEYRPVARPRYGGSIERVIGTLLKEIHDLPGTTFSSIKDREGYDSDKHASITITELEEWFVTFICKVYHKRLHTGIGMTPERKWEIGIFGNAETPGIGLPPRPEDRMTIFLDFLPAMRRTIQTYGVKIDGMTYYAEALRPWINAEDPDTKEKKEFTFRRDPRDISSIWFFDPVLKQYYQIPFADQALPALSLWEYKQARHSTNVEGARSVNDHQILHAITELRIKVNDAQEKSKKARRSTQRRKEHEKRITPASKQPPGISQEDLIRMEKIMDLNIDEVADYGDIS